MPLDLCRGCQVVLPPRNGYPYCPDCCKSISEQAVQREREIRAKEAEEAHRKNGAILANPNGYVEWRLRQFNTGISTRELASTLEVAPSAFLKAVPEGVLGPMMKGHLPNCGAGLTGLTGIGKSSFWVALIKRMLAEYVSDQVRADDAMGVTHDHKITGDWAWSNWKTTVAWARQNIAFNDHPVDRHLDRLSRVPLLVLDDLGRERIKGGDYAQDYGTDLLDLVVDARYRAELPILWTSNLRVPELNDTYGSALVRRLVEPNPPVWIDGLKSFQSQRRSA